ncbi:MAG: BMP family ABC transporter substrate-binding protein [Treponema sp.]|nr:BMP family ABC transporter substrate-binding protein [Treponema sp.]
MKKVSLILLAVLVLFSSACSRQQSGAGRSTEVFELALVTDLGTIDDKSFNQGSWEGLVEYASANNITHKYYQPSEQSNDSYLSTIDLAVRGGAKLIVTPGFLFETPVFVAQDRYPDVNFILVDGQPNDGDWSKGAPVYRTGKNVVGVLYAEDQAGFLAGYAAVKDGNTSLGFMGGMAVPAVVRFGYGFVQGAEYAASELGLSVGSISIQYHYTGHFNASPEVQTMAASWYNAGVDVIFGCGGAVGNSVMAAAEQAGKKVIGVDVDQSSESHTVITSAMKGLQASVFACISTYYSGRFPGGQTQVFEAVNSGVGLPMSTSRFINFNDDDYNGIYHLLANGTIPRMMDVPSANGSPSVVPVRIVRVTEVN